MKRILIAMLLLTSTVFAEYRLYQTSDFDKANRKIKEMEKKGYKVEHLSYGESGNGSRRDIEYVILFQTEDYYEGVQ